MYCKKNKEVYHIKKNKNKSRLIITIFLPQPLSIKTNYFKKYFKYE